jgi:hypothetical protein
VQRVALNAHALVVVTHSITGQQRPTWSSAHVMAASRQLASDSSWAEEDRGLRCQQAMRRLLTDHYIRLNKVMHSVQAALPM